MDLRPDNAPPVEEIQHHLALCEAQAAHYRKLLLAKLHPVSSTAGEPRPPGHAAATAATAPPAADSSRKRARSNSKWPDPVRQRTQQERSTQPMSRSVSCRSDQSISLQQPSAAASLASPALDRRSLSRGSPAHRYLPSVQEHAGLPDVGIPPDVYVARNWVDEHSYLATTRTNLSAHDVYNSWGPSACPSMISGSSAVAPSQPLTRQSSSFESHAEAEMLRFVSSQSGQMDGFPGPEAVNSSHRGEKRRTCDQDFFGVGAAFPQDMPHNYPSSAATPSCNLFQPAAASMSMERSGSNASITSVKSTGSNLERRFKEACQRVRQNSSRNHIAPKPQDTPAEKAPGGGIAPSKREGKVALQKTPYQRPKHPRVYCNQCDDHPDGFRGDHELRRHLNAKHKGVVKKFVCRDPATVGIRSSVSVLYPLSECRACTSHKQYGAYYNAAAHLRRTHFKPRAARGKKGPAEERRGGKGGGDWPPMADLKLWYEEVLVPSSGDALTVMDDEDMADRGEEDVTMNMFPDLGSGSAAFDVDDGYGLPLPGTVNISVSADMASTPAPMAFLQYESMAYTDDPAAECAFSGESKSAFTSSDTVTPASFYDPNSQVITDYLWNVDDV